MTPVVSWWYIGGTWEVIFTEETDILTLIILQKIDNAGHTQQMRKELMRLQEFYVLWLIKAEHLHEDSFHLLSKYTRGIFLANGLYDLTSVVLSLFGKSVCGAIFRFYISLCRDTCCFVQRVLRVCVTMWGFGSSILYKATSSPHSEYLLIWDVPADHALCSGGTPGAALHVLWVHHQGADGLLQFLKGLYNLLVLVGIIQRAFHWFVVAKIQLSASSVAAQVAKPRGRLLSN